MISAVFHFVKVAGFPITFMLEKFQVKTEINFFTV